MGKDKSKIVLVLVLCVALGFVLYTQYGGEDQPPTELAIINPDLPVRKAKSEDAKKPGTDSNQADLKAIARFNPFMRGTQINALYVAPKLETTSGPTMADEPASQDKSETLVSTQAPLPMSTNAQLQAVFEGPNGWVALINSRHYRVNDKIFDASGLHIGTIVSINSRGVSIARHSDSVD